MDHDQIRQLLTRAQEIQHQQLTGDEAETEVDMIVAAAQETGLSREAVMQALRERTNLAERPVEAETLVFALGGGKHFHAAKVRRVEDGLVTVKFLSGAEVTLPRSDIKPFNMIPGQKVSCPWPNWGWWNSTVLSYDDENQKVYVTDGWGDNQTFHISDIRIATESPPLTARTSQWLIYAAVALTSGGIGALLMRLFMR